MGISNLLPFLGKSTKPCHVSQFRGQTVAVDAYCWLHKGARGCAMQLVKNEETDSYVKYCIVYIKMLLSYGIKPILVFDGRDLPAKNKTNDKRSEQKKFAKHQGMECLRSGQINEAYKYFAQCINITPKMALSLIIECRKLKIDCIVAPYEADAQLAFLVRQNIAQVAISEDSDLLVFGCNKVLYKMGQTGEGVLVDIEILNLSMKMRDYSFDKFRFMCILAGCDYLPSLRGIGLKKALKFLSMTAETNPAIFLDRMPRYLNMKNLVITDVYKKEFLIANATFQHQTIFDPFSLKLVPLTPIENSEFCVALGDHFDNNDAYQLALGNLDPLTWKKISNWDPTKSIMDLQSIWSKNFVVKDNSVISKVKSNPVKLIDKISEPDEEDTSQDMDLLEFYKEHALPGEKTPEEVIEEEFKMSPIISNNPFIGEKISRFQRTNEQPNKIVLSRFFSKTEEKDEISVEEEAEVQIENIVPKESHDTHDQTKLTTVDVSSNKRKKQMTITGMFKKMKVLQ